MKCFVLFLFCTSVLASEEPEFHPLYKYRYQTQDVMKSSASDVPVRGYHIAEGSYFPEKQPNFYPNFEHFGPSKFDYFDSHYQPQFFGAPYGNWHGGSHHYPHHGGFVDKNFYSGENKNAKGHSFENAEGNKGVSAQHGNTGFSKGEVAIKDAKGDSGHYQDEGGFRKGFDDAKSYQGGQHYNREGENGQNQKQNQSHKKGHATKGFKTSHHKDESGKTETFYDEGNDEGGSYHYDGNQGAFGEKGESSYKGGHENGQFAADEQRKQGHYDRHRVIDNANADKGAYDQKGYQGSGEVYRINNGIGQQSLLGRQEANREFFHHHPYGYIPFNPGY